MGGPINPFSTAGPKFTGLMSFKDAMAWPEGILSFGVCGDMLMACMVLGQGWGALFIFASEEVTRHDDDMFYYSR